MLRKSLAKVGILLMERAIAQICTLHNVPMDYRLSLGKTFGQKPVNTYELPNSLVYSFP